MESPANTPNPYAPPRASVQDIADPGAPFVLAERSTRLVALFVDGLILAICFWLPLVLTGGTSRMLAAGDGGFGAALFGTGSLVSLAGLIAWVWVSIVLVKRNGQSIAKKLLGIKVVMSSGAPASLGRIFWLRNVVNGILGMVPFYGLIDALVIFGEPRRCLHDRIADTIVIKA